MVIYSAADHFSSFRRKVFAEAVRDSCRCFSNNIKKLSYFFSISRKNDLNNPDYGVKYRFKGAFSVISAGMAGFVVSVCGIGQAYDDGIT